MVLSLARSTFDPHTGSYMLMYNMDVYVPVDYSNIRRKTMNKRNETLAVQAHTILVRDHKLVKLTLTDVRETVKCLSECDCDNLGDVLDSYLTCDTDMYEAPTNFLYERSMHSERYPDGILTLD
jgi:hypothetical protein